MAIPNNKLKDVSFSTQFDYSRPKLKGAYGFYLGQYGTVDLYIPHPLGYRPYFRLYMQLPGSGRVYHMESGPASYGLAGYTQVESIGSDGGSIHVRISDYGGTSGNGVIYYRIYEDRQ